MTVAEVIQRQRQEDLESMITEKLGIPEEVAAEDIPRVITEISAYLQEQIGRMKALGGTEVQIPLERLVDLAVMRKKEEILKAAAYQRYCDLMKLSDEEPLSLENFAQRKERNILSAYENLMQLEHYGIEIDCIICDSAEGKEYLLRGLSQHCYMKLESLGDKRKTKTIRFLPTIHHRKLN